MGVRCASSPESDWPHLTEIAYRALLITHCDPLIIDPS
ncbi:hypothetical protein MT_57040 [Pseudomonas phage phiPto-bp6g]|nr:hypothetical protein MT_57040 [Pseudomonas phage phiPto-bp6g]